jgi:hypothetical protein
MSRTSVSFLRPALARRYPNLASSVCFSRQYSIHADHAAPSLQEIDASRLSIERTLTPKALTPPEELVFGRAFTGKNRFSPLSVCETNY